MTDLEVIAQFKGLTPLAFKQTENLLFMLLEGRPTIWESLGCSDAVSALSALKPIKGAKQINHFQALCDSIVESNVGKFMELYHSTVKNSVKHIFHTGFGAFKDVRLNIPVEVSNSVGEKLMINAMKFEVRVFATPNGTTAEGKTYDKKEATKIVSDEKKAAKELENKSLHTEADNEIAQADAAEDAVYDNTPAVDQSVIGTNAPVPVQEASFSL